MTDHMVEALRGKLTKTQAGYHPKEQSTPQRHCSICKFYIHLNPANGECQIVAGNIDPDAGCNRFKKAY